MEKDNKKEEIDVNQIQLMIKKNQQKKINLKSRN